VKSHNVDLLALHWVTYDIEALVLRALKARVPFVFINHFDNGRLSLADTRKWISLAAGIGTVSGQGVPRDLRDRYVNLSDAVDTEFFTPEKARPAESPVRPIVFLPGRIEAGKGHHDLIEAARILTVRNMDCTIYFAGLVISHSVHEELRRAANGLEGRVLFLGEISAVEMRDWYARCSVVVLPSYSEGLGRVLLEAQAMKKPVVAYDCGGIRDALVPNETGFLVNRGNIEALADRIGFLLDNEVQRLRMGESGRSYVSTQFSMSALIQRHEAFYLSALSSARRQRTSGTEDRQYSYRTYQVSGNANRNGWYDAGAEPLVSILIPAYNAQEWIADTLRSALAQTWQRKEIIVVNDGSTDQTLRIVRGYKSKGVRVVTQERAGAAAARNKAFSLCCGDYIQWLDADDLLAPDKIERQMEVLKLYPGRRVLLSSAWGKFVYRVNRAAFKPTALWRDLSPVEWLVAKMGENLYMQTASWLVSRELAEIAGPWDPRLLYDDDGEYFCRVLLASERVRFVPGAKVYHRGPGLAFRSLSYIGQSGRKIETHWLSMKLHISYLRSLEDSDRVRTACLSYLQNSLLHFYPERKSIVKEAEEIARKLGGQLQPPLLSWKYSWMKTAFGWRLAKTGQQLLLKCRWAAEKHWDHSLFCVQQLRQTPSLRPLQVLRRTRGHLQRASAHYLYRRPLAIHPRVPLISFTFDDFPRSSLLTGGSILKSLGATGTYYACFGLIGKLDATGRIFSVEDVKLLLEQGHELGCHTFGHCPSWDTKPRAFEDSILENRRALRQLFPEASFKTFSYPLSLPRPRTKQRASKYFACCRDGGQTFNVGTADLNCLSAYFLEQSGGDRETVKRLIDENCRAGGWLVFATHDVCKDPTSWGCTPEFFEDIVRYSVTSGAQILPVFQAYEALRDEIAPNPSHLDKATR
jgi:glycosyltransferase involved in cell wall biosynthesis/peptidoglycan/xylan/chitin deacetylase (PgdA/CDA1 family)